MRKNIQPFPFTERIPFPVTIYHKWIACACLLGVTLASCGLSTDSAGTVDDAVTLLQDLNDRNVWETISDRLITLNDQTSYRATITLQSGSITESGEFTTPLETDIALVVEVDDHSNAQISLTENGQTTSYRVLGYTSDETAQTRIYRAGDNGFVCVIDGEPVNLLQGGIQTLFDVYGIETIGMQTLAVVDRTDNEDAMIAGRKAIEYDLVSKLDDALTIAAEFDNANLQEALDEAGQFELKGDLYLDDETLALLRVTNFYTDLAAQQKHNLSFEITQWGGIADIVVPAAANIIEACN
jgi:hypothetical protein